MLNQEQLLKKYCRETIKDKTQSNYIREKARLKLLKILERKE